MKKIVKFLAIVLFFYFNIGNAVNRPILNENTIFDVDNSGKIILYTVNANGKSLQKISDELSGTNGNNYTTEERAKHGFSYGVSDLIEMKWQTSINSEGKIVVNDSSKPFSINFLTGDNSGYSQSSSNGYNSGVMPSQGHSNFSQNEKFINGIRDELYQGNARIGQGEIINFGGIQVEAETNNGATKFFDKNNFFYKKGNDFYNGQKICPAKKTTQIKLFATTEEDLLSTKKRHLPRFRKVGGKIFMIGGWKISGGASDFFKDLRRKYENELHEIIPKTSFTFLNNNNCPSFTNEDIDDEIYTDNMIGQEESPWSGSIPNNGGIVDIMKIGGNTFYIIRNNNGIYLGKNSSTILSKVDDVKYFFNSQVHCPNTNECFYAISGGTKYTNFENPRELKTANKYDFIKDLKIYKITSNGTVKKLTGDKYPKTLPQLNGYGTGRILHQVVLSGNNENNLNIKIYGGYIIDKKDIGRVKGQFPNFEIDKNYGRNGAPDSVEMAQKEWVKDKTNIPGGCGEKFHFNPSRFLSPDLYNYYEWKTSETDAKWHFFNFGIGEIENGENTPTSVSLSQSKENKIFEYTNKNDIKSKTNSIAITMNDFKWAWKYGCHHKCGRKCCDRGFFVKINGKTNIDTYYTYSEDSKEINGLKEGNMKVNINPIQSLSNDNKLTFSGNFDFSETDHGSQANEEKYKNNKKFLGAILMEEVNIGDDFSNKDILDQAFIVKNTNPQVIQYQKAPATSTPICGAAQPSGGVIVNQNDLTPQFPSLKGQLTYNTTPQPKIGMINSPKFTVETGANFPFQAMKAQVDAAGEKGSFVLEKEFEPGWHRVHLLVASTANPARQSLLLQSNMGTGFMGKSNTWKWGRHSGVIQPESFGAEYDQTGFMRIFYKAFIYEFYVPKITNSTGTLATFYGDSPVFKGKYTANNSQLFFYSSSQNSFFRLNDLAQNTPQFVNKFSLNYVLGFSSLENKTSNKVNNIVKILKNTDFHHKIRSSESEDVKNIGEFDFKPVFNFEKNKKQKLYYSYADKLGNIIGGNPLEFQLKEDLQNAKIILNESLEYTLDDIIINKNSIRPFISGYFFPKKEMRMIILTENSKIIDEIMILTESDGKFEVQPNSKLLNGKTYNLMFLDQKTNKIGKTFKLKINENKGTPKIILNNGELLFSKRPIFYGEGKAGKSIKIKVFTENQKNTKNIKCEKKEDLENGEIFSCNKLGEKGTINILSEGSVQINENGNWNWELEDDLVDTDLSFDSKNIYFIKIFYNGEENKNYELKSFRFLSETKEKLSNKIITGTGDVIKIIGTNKKLLEIELKRGKKTNANNFSKIKLLEKGFLGISGNFEFKIKPFSFLRIEKGDGDFIINKGAKIILGENGIGKYLVKKEQINLKKGDSILSGYNGATVRGNGDFIFKFSPHLEIIAYDGKVKIKTKIKKYFSKENIDKLSFFDCDKVFSELKITEKNREKCLLSISTLLNNDKVKTNKNFKITNIKNGQILLSGDGKYLIQGNAWPNSRVKISVNSIPVGSATTSEQGQFLFRLPKGFSKGYFSTRTARIRIDNSDIASQSIEFFVIIRSNFNDFEKINPNNLIQNTNLNLFKENNGNINKSVKLNKIPSFGY